MASSTKTFGKITTNTETEMLSNFKSNSLLTLWKSLSEGGVRQHQRRPTYRILSPSCLKHYLYFWHYLLIIFARIRSQNCLKLIWSSEWAFEVSVRPSITTYHFLTASHRGKVQELLQYFQCHQWWLSLWQAPCLIPKWYQLKWNSTGVKGSRTLGINNHCHCGKRLA